MDQTKLAHAFPTDAAANESDLAPMEGRIGEIRLLSDLELVLAGGGDQTVGWP